MRSIRYSLKQIATILLLTLGMVNNLFAEPVEKLLKNGDTLNIILMDSIAFSSSDVAAFHYAKQGIENARKETEINLVTEYKRFGQSISAEHAKLTLHIFEFSPSSTRFMAILQKGALKKPLGYFKIDLGASFTPNVETGSEDIRSEIMKKAAVELWNKLSIYIDVNQAPVAGADSQPKS